MNRINGFIFALIYIFIFTSLSKSQNTITLSCNGREDTTISFGSHHAYCLALVSTESVDILINQKEVILNVAVLKPSGKALQGVKVLRGGDGNKYLSFNADTTGIFTIDVTPSSPTIKNKKYSLNIIEILSPKDIAAYKQDTRVQWLKDNALSVVSIDPSNENFSDLLPLKDVIGDAEIILLGEACHGDGSAFLAKTRLIKFLHEQKGFDVVAFEGGMYDMQKAWQSILAKEDALSSLQSANSLWANTNEYQPFIRYVERKAVTERPLYVAGFDDLADSLGRNQFLIDLHQLLNKYSRDLPHSTDDSLLFSLFKKYITVHYTNEGDLFKDTSLSNTFISLLDLLDIRLSTIQTAQNERELSFWKQILITCRKSTEFNKRAWSGECKTIGDMSNPRDEWMAKNIAWLHTKFYPNKKMIVWTASAHAMRNAKSIKTRVEGQSYDDFITMGECLWRMFGKKIYTIGFTPYEGEVFNPKLFNSPVSIIRDFDKRLEIEELMNYADFTYGFIDLRHLPQSGNWLKEEQLCKVLGNWSMSARWDTVLDGLFFIKEMKPATQLKE